MPDQTELYLIIALTACLFGTVVRIGFLNKRITKLEKNIDE